MSTPIFSQVTKIQKSIADIKAELQKIDFDALEYRGAFRDISMLAGEINSDNWQDTVKRIKGLADTRW